MPFKPPYFLTLLACLVVFGACDLLNFDNENPSIPGKVVYSTPANNSSSQIFTAYTNGQGTRQLTHFKNGGATNPVWSPDGKHIAFNTDEYFYSSAGVGIYTMDANGENIEVLRNKEGFTLLGTGMEWSPDGTKIAYHSCPNCVSGGYTNIYVYDLTTQELTRVTNNEGSSRFPSWSADSKQLAFLSNRDYIIGNQYLINSDIYIMNIDGTNIQRVTDSAGVGRPSWDSTGQYLVFNKYVDSIIKLRLYSLQKDSLLPIEDSFTKDQVIQAARWSKQTNTLFLDIRNKETKLHKYFFFDIESKEVTPFGFKPVKRIQADWYSGE